VFLEVAAYGDVEVIGDRTVCGHFQAVRCVELGRGAGHAEYFLSMVAGLVRM
jgi:hypothetical protein